MQLPALLIALGPGTAAVHSLATDKVASICGTSASAVTYYRRCVPQLRAALPMAGRRTRGRARPARAWPWCSVGGDPGRGRRRAGRVLVYTVVHGTWS